MTNHSSTDELIQNLQQMVQDAEALLKNSTHDTGEGFKHAKERMELTIANAKDELLHLKKQIVDTTRETAKKTDAYVHENPWQAAGLAAAIGLVVGLLITRK